MKKILVVTADSIDLRKMVDKFAVVVTYDSNPNFEIHMGFEMTATELESLAMAIHVALMELETEKENAAKVAESVLAKFSKK